MVLRPLIALVLASLAGACTIDGPNVDIDGKDVEAIFIHTSDIHSRLIPYNMDLLLTDQKLGMEQKYGPFGGVARLSALLKQERRNHPRVAYIDTGDVFQGAPVFNEFGGDIEFKAMTQNRVDAFTIGNHEFDSGAHHFVRKAVEFAHFAMLGGNYSLQDWNRAGITPNGRVAQPYTIINMKGLRVGIIGLASMGGSYGANLKGLVRLNNIEVAQKYVDFLRPIVDLVVITSHVGYHDDREIISRTEGVDLYFGGHLHIALNPPEVVKDCDVVKLERERDLYICDTPAKLSASAAVCEGNAECDKLTGADQTKCKQKCAAKARTDCATEAKERHYKEKLAELDQSIAFLKRRKCRPRDVPLVHSGAFLKYIGKLEVTLRQCNRLGGADFCLLKDTTTGKCVPGYERRRTCRGSITGANDWEVLAHKYTLVPVDSRLPSDPQMLALLEPYTLKLNRNQRLTEVIGFASERVHRFASFGVVTPDGQTARAGGANKGDSPLGNLVCDSMGNRAQVWADFAVTNSLGMRSDIIPGPLDVEQMNNVFPFENSITVMYLSGFEVQEMMDFISQRSASRGCQPQAQVSGITATLNCKGCDAKGGNSCVRSTYDGQPCAQKVTIGGSGRPCSTDADCKLNAGRATGEICSTLDHPDKVSQAGKSQCRLPLVCNRVYRLATNDYVAHGGSGFAVLARNTTQKNLKIPLRDSATDFIVNMPGCASIPQTYKQKVDGKPIKNVITEVLEPLLPSIKPAGQPASGGDWLKQMEAAATSGDWKGANTAMSQFVTALKGAKNAIKSKTDATRKGLINYLACIDEAPNAKTSKCLGLTCQQKRLCTTYKVADRGKCEALARVRSAMTCINLPCITAEQEGRINLIKNDGAGTADPSDPFPE